MKSVELEPSSGGLLRRFNAHELGLVLAIVLVIGGTILLDEQRIYVHAPRESVIDIVRTTSMLGIFALGAGIVIISGGIDLSVGSVIAFSGTICASIMLVLAPEAMLNYQPVGLPVITAAIVGTIIVGVLIGTLHAWLISVVGLPPFVATLATLVGLRSLARALTEYVTATVAGPQRQATQIQIFDDQFRYLATSVWIPAVVFLVLAALTWLMMSRTVVGRHLYALGGNEEAARLSGIRTERIKWLAYCLAAVFSSIAGILYIADHGVSDPQTLGRAYELNAIAAAVVGGCSLTGGVGTIPGIMLGCLFLRVVIDGVSKIIDVGAELYEGQIVGILVVMAVAFNQWRQLRSGARRAFPGALGLVAAFTLVLLALTIGTLLSGATGGVITAAVTLVIISGMAYRGRKSAT